jgi:molybdenum cofactor biosynthesis enzyme MoaA
MKYFPNFLDKELLLNKKRISLLELPLTGNCNHRCTNCDSQKLRVLYDGYINSYQIVTIVKEIVKQGYTIDNILLSGGEPLLNVNSLKETIKALEGYNLILRTYLFAAPFEKLEKLVTEYGIKEWIIPFFSTKEDVFKKITNTTEEGALSIIMSNIQSLSLLDNTNVTVEIVLMSENKASLKNTVVELSNIGVDDFIVRSHYKANNITSQLNRIPATLLEKHPYLQYQATQKQIEGALATDSYLCYSSNNHMVLFNNYIFPCSMFARNYDPNEIYRNRTWDSLFINFNKWRLEFDCTEDPFCTKRCPSILRTFNNEWKKALITKMKKGV